MPNMTTTTMMSALTATQDSLSILIAKIGENDSSVIGPVAYSIANKESRRLSIIIQKQFLDMVTDAEANGVDAETRNAVLGLGQAAVMKIAEKISMAENMHSIIVSDRNNVESAHRLRAGAVQTIINNAGADVQANVTAAIVAENRRNTERGVNNMKIRGYGGKMEPEAKRPFLVRKGRHMPSMVVSVVESTDSMLPLCSSAAFCVHVYVLSGLTQNIRVACQSFPCASHSSGVAPLQSPIILVKFSVSSEPFKPHFDKKKCSVTAPCLLDGISIPVPDPSCGNLAPCLQGP